MRFTIAIPTYNNAKTISKTIESCINQDFDNNDYEVIVVDNASTDETSELLKNFGDKIVIHRNEQTVSMYMNHNICLDKAKGDYIIYCHSDDELLKNALSKFDCILKQRQDPKKYVLWGRSMFRDYYGHLKREGYSLNEILSGISILKVFQGGLTPSGTCYSTKSFLKDGGFINVDHVLASSDLVTLWKLIIRYYEFEMSDRIFFKRTNASTANGSKYNRRTIQDSLDDAFFNLFKYIQDSKQKLILRYIIKSSFDNINIINSLFRLNKISFREYFIKKSKIYLHLIIGR